MGGAEVAGGRVGGDGKEVDGRCGWAGRRVPGGRGHGGATGREWRCISNRMAMPVAL